ncbi:secretin receptor-like isoform X2 [Periplaneta americana]
MRQQLRSERERCLAEMSIPKPREMASYCDVMWDEMLCWRHTLPGVEASQRCPEYTFVPKENATRQCRDDGTWSLEEKNCVPDGNSTPIVLVGPVETSALLRKWVPILITVSQAGHGISLATLLVSFTLLCSMKKLRCPRNMLHLHLFFSFILRAFVTLLLEVLFVKGVGLAKDVEDVEGGLVSFIPNRNNWECKTLIALYNYCIMANYAWICMEGLYLHNLIFLALSSDTSAIALYVIIGWGLPVVFIIPWVAARVNLEDTLCWTTHDNRNVYLIVQLPIVISVLLSFGLFVNIVRVLFVKMKVAVSLERRRMRYRRWAKSTLVLMPLFGVHYVLFLWMDPLQRLNDTLTVVCLFINEVFASLQGFCVALLYCLLNSEVRAELVRKWRWFKYSREQPTRGSAHSMPLGLNSVLTVSRMYNGGGGGRGGSISSASGLEDIPSVSKYLQADKLNLNSDLHSCLMANDHNEEEPLHIQDGFASRIESSSETNNMQTAFITRK